MSERPLDAKEPARDLGLLERGGGALLRRLLDDTAESLRRQFDPVLLQAAMKSALRSGAVEALPALLAAMPAWFETTELPAEAQLLHALRAGLPIDRSLERVRMSGPLTPAMTWALCRACVDKGQEQHLGVLLSRCDVDLLGGTDVMRLRPMAQSRSEDAARPRLKVWVTGMASLDGLAAAIEVALACRGYQAEVRLSGFGQMHLDLRDPAGAAARFAPDFVVLGYDIGGLTPRLVEPRRNPSDPQAAIAEGVGRLADSLAAWRGFSGAGVVLHTVWRDSLWRAGFYDYRHAGGAASVQTAINCALAGVCEEVAGTYLLDVDELAGQMGDRFHDARRRLYGRYPASADGMATWGVWAADALHVARRGPRKVVVSDLDDTMWGGICGDVGPGQVQVGADFPGNAYLEFQRALLDLKSQGILLALCSKNDPQTALEVFRSCPGMALSLDDVAAWRIGWRPKPALIAELAEELNLGLDAFVFLDDSSRERAAVRRELPEVLTPELPEDIVARPAFVRRLRDLWPVTLTESDLKRSLMYQAQREREKLRGGSASPADFLRSLEQVLTVGPADQAGFVRAAQMHARTNQFNMTTRRHDEGALRRFCAAGHYLFTGSVRDAFGEQGIVIVALVAPEGDSWRLDTLLMSCRVMGRQVETAFIGWLVEQARAQDVRKIVGEYIPSERNAPAASVFKSLGFEGPSEGRQGGSQWWTLDVGQVVLPDHSIEVRETGGGPEAELNT